MSSYADGTHGYDGYGAARASLESSLAPRATERLPTPTRLLCAHALRAAAQRLDGLRVAEHLLDERALALAARLGVVRLRVACDDGADLEVLGQLCRLAAVVLAGVEYATVAEDLQVALQLRGHLGRGEIVPTLACGVLLLHKAMKKKKERGDNEKMAT